MSAPNPGEGYRLLEKGEYPSAHDDIFFPELNGWRVCWDAVQRDGWFYRRRLPVDRKSIDAPQSAAQEEDILSEALRITTGDRQAQYGPPDQDFARTAAMWTALLGFKFEPRDVAMCMILLKLSRERHQRKRDNSVDIAGYARCLHICNQAQQQNNTQ